MTLKQAVARAMKTLNPEIQIIAYTGENVIAYGDPAIARIEKISNRIFVHHDGEHTKDFSNINMKLACAHFVSAIAFEAARKVK